MEAVWRELTKSNVVLPFFFGSVLDTDGLAPGNRICMRTAAGKYTGVVGKGLEFDPPHHYAHTFRGGFNRSSQHVQFDWPASTGPELRREFSIRGSCGAVY